MNWKDELELEQHLSLTDLKPLNGTSVEVIRNICWFQHHAKVFITNALFIVGQDSTTYFTSEKGMNLGGDY